MHSGTRSGYTCILYKGTTTYMNTPHSSIASRDYQYTFVSGNLDLHICFSGYNNYHGAVLYCMCSQWSCALEKYWDVLGFVKYRVHVGYLHGTCPILNLCLSCIVTDHLFLTRTCITWTCHMSLLNPVQTLHTTMPCEPYENLYNLDLPHVLTKSCTDPAYSTMP